jgi:hypothetical protein
MKQLVIILAAVTVSFSAIGQETKKQTRSRKEEKRQRVNALAKQEEEGVIAYKKSFAAGVKLTSDGYGIFVEKGKARSVRTGLLFQLDISEKKHQKEEKTTIPGSTSSPLIYGKLNFFYPIKLGVQLQYLLGNKSNKNGVSVTANFGGGISVGLLRPYMIQILDATTGNRRYIQYDSPDSAYFVNAYSDPNSAGPSFGTGWNHLKVTPGIYLKPALRFDYGRFNEMVSAIEVGLTGEFYSKKIPQMLYNKQKQFFFGAYFSLVFGKRK